MSLLSPAVNSPTNSASTSEILSMPNGNNNNNNNNIINRRREMMMMMMEPSLSSAAGREEIPQKRETTASPPRPVEVEPYLHHNFYNNRNRVNEPQQPQQQEQEERREPPPIFNNNNKINNNNRNKNYTRKQSDESYSGEEEEEPQQGEEKVDYHVESTKQGSGSDHANEYDVADHRSEGYNAYEHVNELEKQLEDYRKHILQLENKSILREKSIHQFWENKLDTMRRESENAVAKYKLLQEQQQQSLLMIEQKRNEEEEEAAAAAAAAIENNGEEEEEEENNDNNAEDIRRAEALIQQLQDHLVQCTIEKDQLSEEKIFLQQENDFLKMQAQRKTVEPITTTANDDNKKKEEEGKDQEELKEMIFLCNDGVSSLLELLTDNANPSNTNNNNNNTLRTSIAALNQKEERLIHDLQNNTNNKHVPQMIQCCMLLDERLRLIIPLVANLLTEHDNHYSAVQDHHVNSTRLMDELQQEKEAKEDLLRQLQRQKQYTTQLEGVLASATEELQQQKRKAEQSQQEELVKGERQKQARLKIDLNESLEQDNKLLNESQAYWKKEAFKWREKYDVLKFTINSNNNNNNNNLMLTQNNNNNNSNSAAQIETQKPIRGSPFKANGLFVKMNDVDKISPFKNKNDNNNNNNTLLVNSRLFTTTPPSSVKKPKQSFNKNNNSTYYYNDFTQGKDGYKNEGEREEEEDNDAVRQAEQWERKFKSLFK